MLFRQPHIIKVFASILTAATHSGYFLRIDNENLIFEGRTWYAVVQARRLQFCDAEAVALAPAKRRFKVLGMGASTLPGVLGRCVISKRDARDHSCDLDLIFICTVSIFATSRRRQVRMHGGDAQRKRGGMAGRADCQLSLPSGPLLGMEPRYPHWCTLHLATANTKTKTRRTFGRFDRRPGT